MRKNNRFFPENSPIFALRIMQFGSKISHEEPDKPAPTPENPAFPDFLEMKSYLFLHAPTHSPGCPTEAVCTEKVSYIPLSGICGIFGGPPTSFGSLLSGSIQSQRGRGTVGTSGRDLLAQLDAEGAGAE
jgi:hypothetical protein